MKNTKKKLLTLVMVLALVLIFVLPTIVGANEIPNPNAVTDQNLKTAASNIIGIAQFVGIAVAVIMLIVYGIRYFTAAPDKQAELKKAVWGYLIGAVCIFGAVTILQFVKKTLEDTSILPGA